MRAPKKNRRGRWFRLTDTVGATIRVSPDVALALPALLIAVTTTWRRLPLSRVRTPYVLPVAPFTSLQLFPFESHRCHWYSNRSGELVQSPVLAVNSSPTRATPVIAGGI